MKKPVYALLLPILLFAMYGCDQPQSPRQAATASAAPVPEGPVIATVNGAPIMKSVLDVYGAQRKAKQGEEEQVDDQEILNEVISLELMRQEGVNKGLDTSPSIVATMDQQTRTLLAGAAIRDFVQNNPVTDEQAREVYDKEIGKPGTEYNARHILVKTQQEAEEIISELDNGGDFSALAREKSTDTSASEGGDLGWFSTAQMVQPFADTVAGLEKGSYTDVPVQTQFGWHVILLEDTRQSTPPAFDDIKDRLKVLVANQQLQQHIQQVREAAKIEITGK
ncbi:MAG: peptidylprolyl isomerase [Gammaproteobacteria bacterium]